MECDDYGFKENGANAKWHCDGIPPYSNAQN